MPIPLVMKRFQALKPVIGSLQHELCLSQSCHSGSNACFLPFYVRRGPHSSSVVFCTPLGNDQALPHQFCIVFVIADAQLLVAKSVALDERKSIRFGGFHAFRRPGPSKAFQPCGRHRDLPECSFCPVLNDRTRNSPVLSPVSRGANNLARTTGHQNIARYGSGNRKLCPAHAQGRAFCLDF